MSNSRFHAAGTTFVCRRSFHTGLVLALAFLLGQVIAPRLAQADQVTMPPNARLTVNFPGKPPTPGRMLWFDDEGFQFQGDDGSEHFFKWSLSGSRSTFDFFNRYLGKDGTAAQWLMAGKALKVSRNAKAEADLAFDHALLLDPSLKPQIDAVRGMPVEAAAPASASIPGKPDTAVNPTPRPVTPAPGAPAVAAAAPSAVASAPLTLGDQEQQLLQRLVTTPGSPWYSGSASASGGAGSSGTVAGAPARPATPAARIVPDDTPITPDEAPVHMVPGSQSTTGNQGLFGGARKPAWNKLSDEQQIAAAGKLKAFAESTPAFKTGALTLRETKFFLFYSDLKPDEAGKWAGLLDTMYARLAELFAVPKEQNLWHGKALIFVFSRQSDYFAYERGSEGTNATGSAGMCNSYSDGIVHIAFYRQPTDLDFAHVLVHESVHGFLHRYRSPIHVPSWANEGLAETIASELVPQPTRALNVKLNARDSMATRGMGEDFFIGSQINAWQYPIAESLCACMIAQNRDGYVKFINAIKDGTDVGEALDKEYGASQLRLVSFFFDAMKVRQPLQ